eukprot:m.85073 g.85073  ORF g.85073 m.85073 type:complete len:451 (-) comp15041_c1_seq1:1249-2601(-)
MDSDAAEVRVQFVTKQTKYAVTDAAIALPGTLRRAQLSQTVNHLLQLDPPVPFDFLIDGHFLRSSLSKYMQDHGISAEEVVKLEFIVAAAPPEPPTEYKHDDWVASVHGHKQGLFLSGSYDGLVRVWNDSAEVVGLGAGHSRPVTSVQWLQRQSNSTNNSSTGENGDLECVSASQDETVRLWRVQGAGAAKPKDAAAQMHCTIVFRGHSAAVNAVAVQPTGDMICTGSWDRTLKVWSTVANADDEVESSAAAGGSAAAAKTPKRSKKSASSLPATVTKDALGTFTDSKGSVSSIIWPELGVVYSAGEDHCIRTWDVQSGINSHTMTGPKAINCIRHSAQSGLIASADFDGKVRLYDPRVTGVVVRSVLASHQAPVTSLAWSPVSQFQLVSGSHDAAPNNLKLWDIRSVNIPLHNINAHTQRVLSVDWPLETVIISGGADNSLKVHQLHAV